MSPISKIPVDIRHNVAVASPSPSRGATARPLSATKLPINQNIRRDSTRNEENGVSKSASRQAYAMQNLSPIKPSFVNFKEDVNTPNNHTQFSHSTPNHQSLTSPNKSAPSLKSTTVHNASIGEKGDEMFKKQTIVKELAVNILELNGYRTRTEQLDNELKSYYRMKRESHHSSKEYASVTEKTQSIQSELEKLKIDMLRKIEDIHSLEVELVKLEGQNQPPPGSYNAKKGLSSQRNEEVMAEIRNMLKEMVNSEASLNPISHANAANQIYEEYSKIISSNIMSRDSAHNQNNSTNHHISATSTPGRRPNDQLENLEVSDIFRRFDVYKNKIEREFIYLVNHSKELQASLNNMDNIDKAMKEIEKFKNLIRLAENNFNQERAYLFAQIDNFLLANNTNQNRVSVANLKSYIEKILADKHIEFQTIINTLYSGLSLNNGRRSRSAVTADRHSDSSFLTEEEEAIKKISERIKFIKAKIDNKSTRKTSSARRRNGSCDNLTDGSSEDDTDNKELHHLNEQIRILKSRMIAKGDQLNMMKKSSNDVFLQQVQQPQPCPGPVYLPVTFKRNGPNYEYTHSTNVRANVSQSHGGEYGDYRSYRVEPLELYEETQNQADSYRDGNLSSANRRGADYYNEQYILCKSQETADSYNYEMNTDHMKTTYNNLHHNHVVLSESVPKQQSGFTLTTKIENEMPPPTRKYTSTVEIPAEQLELMKKRENRIKVTRFRSKSESASLDEEEDTLIESSAEMMNQAFNSTRRHKSVTVVSTKRKKRTNEPNGNILAVSLKSVKYPQPEKQTMTEEIEAADSRKKADLPVNTEIIEKFKKEVDDLKQMLNEKNELINRQSEQQRQLNELKASEIIICQQKNDNLSKMLENQKLEMLSLKNKMNEFLTEKSKTSKEEKKEKEQQKKVNESSKKTTLETGIQTSSLESIQYTYSHDNDLAATDSNTAKHPKFQQQPVVESQYFYETNTNMNPNVAEEFFDTSLICNIPEHHRLEDIVHQHREQIANLKYYIHNLKVNSNIDEIAVLEKKAEIEALDLAINDRKSQLVEIELAKNRKLYEGSHQSNSATHSPASSNHSKNSSSRTSSEDEAIYRKGRKNTEFAKLQDSVKRVKKELKELKNLRLKTEKEMEVMGKKNEKIQSEASDKIAEEINKELMLTREELKRIREDKSRLETEVSCLRDDLRVQKSYKSYDYDNELKDLRYKINDQKQMMESLNSEIANKNHEIAMLRERNATSSDKFKTDVGFYQREVNSLKSERDELMSQLDQVKNDIKAKKSELNQLEYNLNKTKRLKDEESEKLEKVETELSEKNSELHKSAVELEKILRNYERLKSNENELVNSIQSLDMSLKTEKANYEQLKSSVNELTLNKTTLKNNVDQLNEELARANNDYTAKEQQYNKLVNSIKDKQNLLKTLETEITELETGRDGIVEELNQLKDRLRKRKSEHERMSEANKNLEYKMSTNQNELNLLENRVNEVRANLEDSDMRYKDLSNKLHGKQVLYDQLSAKCAEKKDEYDQMATYLDEIKTECQFEKKQLTNLQSENQKMRKNCDQMRFKLKNLTKALDTVQANQKSVEQLEDELAEKDKTVKDLEEKLFKREQDVNKLNDAFNHAQEEAKLFKARLKNIEEILIEQNYCLNELNEPSISVHERLEQAAANTGVKLCDSINKNRLSSLLITPKLRKTISYQLIDSATGADPMRDTEPTYTTSSCCPDNAGLYIATTSGVESNKPQRLNVKSIIESLRLNLNDIESITANNIYKITALKT